MTRRVSYANVMATLALFASIGGSSYAALRITGRNVANGTLTGADIKDHSLTSSDLRAGTLPGPIVTASSAPIAGPAGPSGQTGPIGPIGPPGNQGLTGPAGLGSAAKGVEVSPDDSPVTLAPGADWITIARVQTTLGAPGVLAFSGAVEERSASKTDQAAVELRLLHNGHTHPLPSQTTLDPAQAGTGTVDFVCDEFAGVQDAQLQARATGAPVAIGNRTLDVMAATRLP